MEELNKGYEFTKAQIAELESLRAWKAEIEKQEPVAWMKRNHSDDGWVLVKDISLMLPNYRTGYKPLFDAPVVSPDVEKLKSEIADLQVFCDRLNDRRNSLVGENQSLKTELEAARKDAERYRLIRSKLYDAAIPVGDAYLTLRVVGSCPTLEQFDAAIEQAKGGVK